MTAISTVTSRQTGDDARTSAPTSAQADAFSAAAGGGTPSALMVSGNTIDTGRYVITGSNDYTRPNDGIHADDGMVTVTDTVTHTFVDVFGDPHVFTSDGDRAEFQKDGLRIDLADGTRVEFKPTAQTNGFSHIDSMSVTKGDQTVVARGFYADDGSARVSTGPVQGDATTPARGFNDPNATVMTTAAGGGLNTLVNAHGVALSDKVNQTSLDGMGGASPAPGAVSPQLVALLQKLVTLLQQEVAASATGTAGSGALVSDATPGGAAQPVPGAATATAGAADKAELLQQVASLLQQLTAALSSPAASAANPGPTAGSGPNTMLITDTQDHPITVEKFKNGESTTTPSATVTLQPGQTGALLYGNGEAGFAAQADAGGTVQPNASRLEYEADTDGVMKYPDVSYIDGRNASITLSDGAGLSKGDSKSIAADAPAGTVTQDSAGNKTVAGWYDGSTATMQAGGAYMQAALGTSGAYLHPDDDRRPTDSNPMSATQSATVEASFGAA